jgi:putative two-component system response regulator
VPGRALLISLAALAVPVLAFSVVPAWLQRNGALLVWLPVLIPAFLLTYYRGWEGASEALAAGMAVLALTQVEIIVLDLATPNWGVVFTVVAILLTVALGTGWVTELLHRERDSAERSALTDPLTGLPNRRHASVFTETAWGSAVRGRHLSVILFDLDHFKQVNDRHGHSEGDRVLATFADILKRRTRRMDLSARFGGEEFMTILCDCAIDQAETFAQEVATRFAATDFGWGRVTVSAGVSGIEEGMGSPDVLIAAADRSLYAAKALGRNCVRRADRPLPPTPPPDRTVVRVAEPPVRVEELRVLVVDDDPATLRATRRLLEHLGCEVTSADAPRVAVDILKSEEPIDLLVTDIVMPEMSGFTLVDLTAGVRPGLPVLYMSGYPQDEVYWGGTPGARSAFLAKPMEIDDLRHAVESLLSGPEAPEPVVSPAPEPRVPQAPPSPGVGSRRRSAERHHLEGRLLVIDDDESVLRTLQRLFERAGYDPPVGLTDPREVSEVLLSQSIDLIILDLHMPQMDGFEVLDMIRPLVAPEEYLPVIVLTGDDAPELRRRALAAGAMDFLAKPFDPAEAEARVRNLLATRFLTQRVSHQRDELEERVHERTSQLADTRTEILYRLARAAEYRDDITGRHAERIGLLGSLLAAELGMSAMEVDLVRKTGPLHDIGKIAMPDAILRKPGKLTPSEFELMKSHTTIGAEILGGSRHRILQVAERIAEAHHERWDGGGYPHGLSGEDTPIEARVIAVADTFDTLTHNRPYREAGTAEDALAEIVRCRGTHFDPDVVDAFRSIYERVGAEQLPALADPIDPLRDTTRAQPSAPPTD